MPKRAPIKAKSTWEQLSPTGYPCLFRHENGSYYGVKKVGGTKKIKALVTEDGQNITARKVAEKALSVWIASLLAPPPVEQDLTFRQLWDRFVERKIGKSTEGTLETYAWSAQCVDVSAPELWKMRIADIKPTHLAVLLAKRWHLSPHSVNRLSLHLKMAFEVAVADSIISESPYTKIPKKDRRKKQETKPEPVPTIEECEKICAHVRNQEFADTADKTADMLDLMHRAILGQAELVSLDWKDVRWEEKKIIIWKRHKTGQYFEVPFYAFLEPFLLDLWERQGKPKEGKVVSILTPAVALRNACRRMKMPQYSPRDFRKARIVWLLRRGVPVEYIAKIQGHTDNGVLIRRTYANVITGLDSSYEEEQLAKMR